MASGVWTDRTQQRKPLVVVGYGLSGMMRPLIGLAAAWPVVLALRQWGRDWGHGYPDIELADQRDGQPIRRITVQAADGRELALGELVWIERAASS